MADLRPIALVQGNDETLHMTITPVDPAEDLTAITALEVFLKADDCTSDADPSTLKLTTASATEVVIVSQTPTQIVADAFIPGTATIPPFDRWWRVDGLGSGGARRTAEYGPATVTSV